VTTVHEEDAAVFQCRLELADGSARIVPIGEVDIETAPIVNDRLEDVRAVGFGRVVLDLCETTFIDSAGLHLAVEWHERARRDGFTFGLTRGPYAVQRTFDAAGIGAALNFVGAAP
jgi:anti-anti-sigma factor